MPVRVAATIFSEVPLVKLRHGLPIAREHGLERLLGLPLRLLGRQCRHAVEREQTPGVHRVLDPQRAVLVERRDALGGTKSGRRSRGRASRTRRSPAWPGRRSTTAAVIGLRGRRDSNKKQGHGEATRRDQRVILSSVVSEERRPAACLKMGAPTGASRLLTPRASGWGVLAIFLTCCMTCSRL